MDILARLENWGRHYRPTHIYRSCGSLEGAYRSNWRQWRFPHEIPMREPIDILDAQLLERGWQGMSSQKQKDALKYHFIFNADPNVIARRAHCRVYQVQELIGNAISALSVRLNLLTNASNHTKIDRNLIPGNREIHPLGG